MSEGALIMVIGNKFQASVDPNKSQFYLYDRRALTDRDRMNESGLKRMTTDVDPRSTAEDFASIDASS